MADNQELPPFISNTKYTCSEHNEWLTEFCRMHDLPMCIKCRRKFHKKCEDVPKIDDIVCNVKESVLFENIFVEIEAICDNLKEIFEDRVNNKQQLEEKRAMIETSLEERIENIIKHLRQKKAATLSGFDSVTSEISKTSKIVQFKEKTLRDILGQKSEITRQASNYQTFIAVKRMEGIVQETNMDIQELSNSGKLNRNNVTFDVSEKIEDTICPIKTFGDIKVTHSPSDVSIKMTKPIDLEAQKKMQTQIELHLEQKIDLSRGWYTGCCTLPSGLIVIAGHNFLYGESKLYIHKPDGSLRSTIKLKDNQGVFDVTSVDYPYFAVSHPLSCNISVIDINTDSVVKTLETGERVYGLCCSGRDIMCCVSGEGLVKVSIDSGMRKYMKVDEGIGYNSHVEVSKDLICYTCPNIHTVTVLDSQYNAISRFKDMAVIEFPFAVIVDNNSNIYVKGLYSDNLIIISPDGKSFHKVPNKHDGLKGPTCEHKKNKQTVSGECIRSCFYLHCTGKVCG